MPHLEEFCVISADLGMSIIGNTPAGMRIDFPFEGTATSVHWDGERPVKGVDYATVRSDGTMDLDIRGVIGSGREKVSYSASGVSLAGEEQGVAHPRELLTFATAAEAMLFLNDSIGVALGKGGDGKLSLTVYLVSD